MLNVFNENGNINKIALCVKDRENLKKYRDTLLQISDYNFEIENKIIEMTLDNSELDKYRNKDNYRIDGDILIRDSIISLKWINTCKRYLYKIAETKIKCNNLVTIQLLSMLLKDPYIISDNELLNSFVKMGLVNDSLPRVNDGCIEWNSVLSGIEKLIDEERYCDLNSFRNSFCFLEYKVLKEIEFEPVKFSDDEIKKIQANTEVLFSENVRVLKKR